MGVERAASDVLPAPVHGGTARPGLPQPFGAAGDPGGVPLLAAKRRGRIPHRRARPYLGTRRLPRRAAVLRRQLPRARPVLRPQPHLRQGPGAGLRHPLRLQAGRRRVRGHHRRNQVGK